MSSKDNLEPSQPETAPEKPPATPSRKEQLREGGFFIIALLLSATMTVAYAYEKPNEGPFSLLIVFIGLVPPFLCALRGVWKLSASSVVGYGAMLLVCGSLFAFMHTPPPSTGDLSREDAAELSLIANTLSSEVWTDGQNYTVYSDGQFDLSKARFMQLRFEPSQAGTKFLLRLVPEGADADKPIGVRWVLIKIPAEGVVRVPLEAKEFGLTTEQMKRLTQIAVLSGANAWGKPLGQEASKRAVFERVEVELP